MIDFHDERRIETPFSVKNDCWFCGEPYQLFFTFPHARHIVIDCPHPILSVPTCNECLLLASKVCVDSIWQVHYQVKHQLHDIYRKDLAIGINWTPQSLAESDFEGGNFEGFKKSAWFMYEVAKKRVNYKSWDVVYKGYTLVNDNDKDIFNFDGVAYPTIDIAISQYVKSYQLNKNFFIEVLNKFGRQKFATAVRFCRLHVNSTPQERSIAFHALDDD